MQYNTCIASDAVQYNIITDGKFIKLGSSYYTCALYNMTVVYRHQMPRYAIGFTIYFCKFMANNVIIKSPSKILQKFD